MATQNAITATGLTIKSLADRVAAMNLAFQTIYGGDINLAPDSPDGQAIAIFQQAVSDFGDLLQQVNAMFDPDQAIGVILDARVAINGIQRQAGTFTVTNVSIVTSGACTLPGLDQAVFPVYTVQDNAGTRWQLQATQNISGSGTTVASFQAATPGAVLTSPNTITIPVSIVLGVTSVNNPTTYTTLGINEETDAALRIRRQQSVSLASQGYLAGLLAALENIPGMASTFIEENNTNTTNADGVTGHSIWVIVSGTASTAAIAQAIYAKRNAGCGMVGAQTYNITQADGSIFTIKWDVVVTVALFVKATLTSIDGVNPPDIAAIRAGVAAGLVPALYQTVNINQLSTLVQAIDDNSLVTSAGFSLASGGAYTNTLTPVTKQKQFAVIAADVILLPVVITTPLAVTTVIASVVTVTLSIASLGTATFGMLGGFGTPVYSVFSGAGSINSSSGVYTAAGPGTDVVRVTDGLGNVGSCTVTVS